MDLCFRRVGDLAPFMQRMLRIANLMRERRSRARVDPPYPIRLRGKNSEGRAFKEETVLDNLSAGGLYLHLQQKLVVGAQVSIAVRLSVSSPKEVPALRLAARGNVLRV